MKLVENGTTEPKQSGVLEVDFIVPVKASELLVPLDVDAQSANQVRSVIDRDALERFSSDSSYLTSVKDPFHYAFEFLDTAGNEYLGGQQLAARFSIPVGEVGLASGDVDVDAKCDDGSQGWNSREWP